MHAVVQVPSEYSGLPQQESIVPVFDSRCTHDLFLTNLRLKTKLQGGPLVLNIFFCPRSRSVQVRVFCSMPAG